MANHYATALNAKPSYGDRFGKKLFTLSVIAIPLGLMTAAVCAYVMPRKYESRAVVQVNPSMRISSVFREDGLQSQMTPSFFATQFEIIRSQRTLAMVSEKLNLANRWNTSEEDGIMQLQAIVDAQNIRGTNLIAITVMHPGPEDARDICQTVYDCYRERRIQEEKKLQQAALQELEKAVQEHAAVLEEKRAPLLALEKKLQAATAAELPSPPNDSLRLKKHLTLLTQAKNDDERLLLATMMLDGENPVKAIYQEYIKAGEDLDVMQKNGLGETHPNFIAQKQTISQLSEKLQASLTAYVQELRTQVGENGTDQSSQNATTDHLILRTQIQTIRAEIETQEQLLSEMQTKLDTDRINVTQPSNIVALHEAPVVAEAPSSPKVRNLFLLGGVGLPIAILLLGLSLTGIMHLASRGG